MMRIEGVKAGLLKLAPFHAVAIPNKALPCYNSSVSRTRRSLTTLRNCSGCSFGVYSEQYRLCFHRVHLLTPRFASIDTLTV